MIPLGDIDLRQEIRNIVYRQHARSRVRRVYSAKVHGQKSGVTVAMYQGTGAEDEWQRDIVKYRTVRQPNIVQVYGIARLGNIHATIFHDELIPYQDFLDLHEDSHFATVYIHAYSTSVFRAVEDYFKSNFQYRLDEFECTFFIRTSAGQLCTDLIPNNMSYCYIHPRLKERTPQQGLKPLDAQNMEATVIGSLTLGQYHHICRWKLLRRRYLPISNSGPVNFGAVYGGSLGNDWLQLCSIPDLEFDRGGYSSYMPNGWTAQREVMETGWTRCTSRNAVGAPVFKWVHCLSTVWSEVFWLSQANHIVNRLEISRPFEDYDSVSAHHVPD
ncbi:hypothetical protein K438DRAFT_2169346 [Mycena galopus ATCC 62051]|nr:hypothetical protein K438DRAFT_2169346 [Mycena galopus ATCC 62051]